MTRGKRGRARGVGSVVALGLFAMLVPEPASAQFFGGGGGPGLPPFAVRRIMNEHGFRVLTRPFRRGEVYVVDAIDGVGRQVRAIVDAYDGTIVQTFAAGEGPPVPRRPIPGGAMVTGERLPFPGERFPDDGSGGPGSRGRDEQGGVFGLFSRAPPDRASPARPPAEPRVVPGIDGPAAGADKPKPRHAARPKTPPRALVRAAPPPLPGPQVTPVPVMPQKPAVEVKPALARVDPAPKRTPPSAVPPANTPPPSPSARPNEARTPSPPKQQAAAPPKSVADKPRLEKPADKPPGDKPPARISATRKQTGPLNDIPPAPLE